MPDPSWESTKARIARNYRETKAIIEEDDAGRRTPELIERARAAWIESKKLDVVLDFLFNRKPGEPQWEYKLRKVGYTPEMIELERSTRARAKAARK